MCTVGGAGPGSGGVADAPSGGRTLTRVGAAARSAGAGMPAASRPSGPGQRPAPPRRAPRRAGARAGRWRARCAPGSQRAGPVRARNHVRPAAGQPKAFARRAHSRGTIPAGVHVPPPASGGSPGIRKILLQAGTARIAPGPWTARFTSGVPSAGRAPAPGARPAPVPFATPVRRPPSPAGAGTGGRSVVLGARPDRGSPGGVGTGVLARGTSAAPPSTVPRYPGRARGPPVG